MNKKIFIILVAVLIICPFLILFISKFYTVQDLMRPPRIYGDNEKIQTAFENSIKSKENLILKYPTEGDYRSSFVMYDVDMDGQEEVLVFYTLKSDETIVRVNILDKVDGKWKSVSDFAGYGSEISSISFVDMNNDGHNEIVICWNLYESKTSKVVTIHKIMEENGKISGLKTLANESCSYFKMVDLDGDGDTEMFLTQIDSSKDTPKACAKLLKMSKKETVSIVGEVSLDGFVSGYSSFKVEEDSNNGPTKIFIDANKGEHQMITEVVYWDKENSKLVAPFFDNETLTNFRTLRTPGISSMDIDGDGKIEIPTDTVKRNNLALDMSGANEISVGITQWCAVNNDELVPKVNSLVNYSDLYILLIDDSDVDSILAYNNLKQKQLTVYQRTQEGTRGNELFSIITVAVGEWLSNPKENYSILKRNNSIVYAYKITKDGEKAGIKPETLISNIKIIQ